MLLVALVFSKKMRYSALLYKKSYFYNLSEKLNFLWNFRVFLSSFFPCCKKVNYSDFFWFSLQPLNGKIYRLLPIDTKYPGSLISYTKVIF
jgi:hypothetical protein